MDFREAFLRVQEILYLGNNHLSSHEFWNLAKSEQPNDLVLLQNLLYLTFEISRIASTLLQPFCPSLASQVSAFLGSEDCSLHVDLTKTYRIDPSKKVFVQKITD